MKVLIIGNGFVGSRLGNAMQSVEHLQHDIITRNQIDYTNPRKLNDFISNNNVYDLVINASGYTGTPNVDSCERDKQACWKMNVVLPSIIEKICMQHNMKLYHISSGCIYTGYEKLWTEDDEPNFGLYDMSSWYSKTKHAAETVLDTTYTHVFRIRMPFTYENVSRNYLVKILGYEKNISMLNSLTSIEDFCDYIIKMITQDHEPGVYNVTHTDPVSTHDIVDIFEKYGVYKEWKFVNIDRLNITAPRSNCILSTDKLQSLNMQLPDVKVSLDQAIKQLSNKIQCSPFLKRNTKSVMT